MAPTAATLNEDAATADPLLESQRHALSQSINSPAGVSFHKNMYIAPLSYAEDYNGLQTEVVFQLSFKARLFGGPLYFGYTQRSYWQAYDKDNSSPFRETNYNPEVFARFQPGDWWSNQWGIDLGIEHESNGREVPDSRSWNRLYTMAFHEGEHDMLSIKAWYRLKEDPKPTTFAAEGDDNPDILDYYGYGELRYRRCLDGQRCLQLFESMLRGNTSTGKGAIELMWSFPAESEQMSWFISLFSGYGESLIDYNHHQNRVAVGVTLRPH